MESDRGVGKLWKVTRWVGNRTMESDRRVGKLWKVTSGLEIKDLWKHLGPEAEGISIN